MKKKVLAVLLTGAMAMSMLTACGGGSKETAETTEKTETVEETAETTDAAADADMCSDDTFEELQDNYAMMVEAYDAVKGLYEMDEIVADADIEDALNQAADVINQMGKITQDTITEEDAETLNSAMCDILDALSYLVDGMETVGDGSASGEACSDETFATLQDNYSVLSETYATVEKAYQSGDIEQSAEVEENLSTIASMIELFGEMTQDNVTEEEAVEFNEGMLEIIDVLQKIVDEM